MSYCLINFSKEEFEFTDFQILVDELYTHKEKNQWANFSKCAWSWITFYDPGLCWNEKKNSEKLIPLTSKTNRKVASFMQ